MTRLHLVQLRYSGEHCIVDLPENLIIDVQRLDIGRKLKIIIYVLEADVDHLGGIY